MKKGSRHTQRKTDDKDVELERGQRAGRGKKEKEPGTEREREESIMGREGGEMVHNFRERERR